MTKQEFTELAKNDQVGALLHLFDQCEAAELEYASLHSEDTHLQSEIDELQPAAPAA